jgi:hypothetical protein
MWIVQRCEICGELVWFWERTTYKARYRLKNERGRAIKVFHYHWFCYQAELYSGNEKWRME